jgi:hypothetical protein
MNNLLEYDQPATEAIEKPTPILSFTGLSDVDDFLRPDLASGSLILAAGLTGGGKSTLCCQVAAQLVNEGRRVIMLSTELPYQEVFERMMSCHVKWDYDKLKNGRLWTEQAGELLIAHDGSSSEDFRRRALPFAQRMKKHFTIHERRDFRTNPLEVLNEILGDEIPDCLIVDALYLSPLVIGGNGDQRVSVVSLAEDVMRILGGCASDFGIPVLVTCQKHPEEFDRVRKLVGIDQISEFPSIGNLCDVFIGISRLPAEAAEADRSNFSPSQYLNITTKSGTKLFPVLTNFGKQCFDHRDEDEVDPVLIERASGMRAKSRRGGYVMFRREVFDQLCDLSNPNCINLYALMLLSASWVKTSQKYGRVSYGREKLAQLSGLTVKQVRIAMKRLTDAKLLRDTGKRMGRAKVLEIVDYGASQDREERGYFILARNLLDPEQSELLGSPTDFRAWLGLLYEARFSTDMEGVERGQLPRDLSSLSQRIGMDNETMHECLGAFIQDGRVVEDINPSDGGIVLRIKNYDLYQSGYSYRFKDTHIAVTELGCDEAENTGASTFDFEDQPGASTGQIGGQ